MANMSLFDKAVQYQKKMTWIDLLSGIKEKHDSEDLENTLLTGTAIDRAKDEKAMLLKWKAPWVFFWALIAGLIMSILFYILAFSSNHPVFIMMVLLFPAFVVPISLLVFFWEMNVPRNISFFQLMLCFALGGIFSMATTLVFSLLNLTPNTPIAAPLTEEPGKLVIMLLLMYAFSKKKGFKIYGMTGMAMGAAVGAGFAAFESAYYVFSYTVGDMLIKYDGMPPYLLTLFGTKVVSDFFFQNTFKRSLETFFALTRIRMLGAFNSHVLYCVLYSTAASLLMENNSFSLKALCKMRFLAMFAASCLFHAANNLPWPSDLSFYICSAISFILVWWLVLCLIRSCFKQIGERVPVFADPNSMDLRLRCISGAHAGKVFAMKHDSVLIGTGANCNLVYPFGTKGISEKHCKLVVQNKGLYLADMASSYGTYLNGMKLIPAKGQLLKKGDCFWLGSENEKFLVE